jgi:hypothetical protein
MRVCWVCLASLLLTSINGSTGEESGFANLERQIPKEPQGVSGRPQPKGCGL